MTRESKEQTRKRVREILRHLHADYPEARCELTYENALQLLVATILSAQCTDKRVNLVTPALFKKYRKPEDFAASPPGVLESEIRSTGFFNNKAKSIRGAGKRIAEHFGGRVPDTMEDLLTLPGIARKSANVILGSIYEKPEGVVVDTHIMRLSGRLGLAKGKNPVQVERELMGIVPREEWIFFGHGLVWHGRRVCNARKPECGNCSLRDLCPYPLKRGKAPADLA